MEAPDRIRNSFVLSEGFSRSRQERQDLVFKEVLFAADKGMNWTRGDSSAFDADAKVPEAQENGGLVLPELRGQTTSRPG